MGICPYLLHTFQNFTCLKYELKKFEIKPSFNVKIKFGRIMSWNVVDEVVLQSPEGVSAGSPPATRLSCHPGPRSVDLNLWHYS